MDQNIVLVERMASEPISGNVQQPVENGISTNNGQRVLIPEVSNLITSVNQLTNQNFELLKMTKLPGNDIGKNQKGVYIFLILKLKYLISIKRFNQHWSRYLCK